MKRATLVLAALALLVGGVGQAEADLITTRSDLNTILGGSGVTETFEGFSISNGTAQNLTSASLNSTTVANGQGPGLVIPGFTITSSTPQWNGNGFFGLATESVAGIDPISIIFTPATSAFGVDLETYAGFPNTVTATVFAPDDNTVIGTINDISIPTPSPVFFGWTDTGGIGKVTFSQATQRNFSPVLDNLTFGQAQVSAVPEPSTLTLLGIGAVGLLGYGWRRRKLAV